MTKAGVSNLILTVAMGLVFCPKSALAVTPLSHRALYDLRIAHVSPESGVAGLRGRLVVEWIDTCTGYTTSQRMYTELGDSGGGMTVTDVWVNSWEARDGSVFRFTVTSHVNGIQDELSRGVAHRGTGDKPGSVTFDKPRDEVVALPRDTIFPTEHMLAVLRAAEQGERAVARVVFDGSRFDGLNDVNAFIGRPSTKREAGPKLRGATRLASGRNWPVSIAYYEHGGTDDAPDYTFLYRLLENGVATDLEFDYGDFAIAGDLMEITPLVQPDCGSRAKP